MNSQLGAFFTKLLISDQKSLWNIRSRLNYLNKVSKTKNVEELSLDLIFQNNCFGKMSKVLVTKLQVEKSLSTGQNSIKTFSVHYISAKKRN